MILDRLAAPAVGPSLSRSSFLQVGAATGGGLILSVSRLFAGSKAEATGADGFAPNAFIRIEADGRIVLTMPYVDMGQGTYTAVRMLIAEELEVGLSQVRLEHAPPNEKLYGNPLLGAIHATGNSNAIRAHPIRSRGPPAPCGHERCSSLVPSSSLPKASSTNWRLPKSRIPSPIGALCSINRRAPKPCSNWPRKRPAGESCCQKAPARRLLAVRLRDIHGAGR